MRDRCDGSAQRDDDAQLIEQYWPSVYRLCFIRTDSHEAAEDAAQQTFVEFLQTDPETIQDIGKWLNRIAVSVCARRFHRYNYKHPTAELSDAVRARALGAVDPVRIAVGNVWVHTLSRLLTPIDFNVLHWHYVDGIPFEQIGRRLGVTTGHARMICFRAVRHARASLASTENTVESLFIFVLGRYVPPELSQLAESALHQVTRLLER